MNVLVVNAGSSSLKYQLIDTETDMLYAKGICERIGAADSGIEHKKMLDDCIKLLRAPYPKDIPCLTVIGNHDFRGKGARQAYMDFAEPFASFNIK